MTAQSKLYNSIPPPKKGAACPELVEGAHFSVLRQKFGVYRPLAWFIRRRRILKSKIANHKL